jgi:glycosyltransferase involved in cell wall biosynthesis
MRDTYRHTGTGVYLWNLLHHLLKGCKASTRNFNFHGFSAPEERWNLNGFSNSITVHPAHLMRSTRAWMFGGMALHANLIRPDLVFLPTAHYAIPVTSAPVITTILDAIPRRLPDAVGESKRLNRLTWINSKLAGRILTISECSKRDLIHFYGFHPSKVDVTYLGYDKERFNEHPPDPDLSATLLARFKIRCPFVLHHGMVQTHKNIGRLIEAWDHVQQMTRGSNVQLVLAGAMGFGSDDIRRRAEMSFFRDHIIFTGSLNDDDLATLVKNAFLCVIPSLYEGFCLPLIEAMACGIPTIASNASCIPEISGGVLEYFDPHSIEHLACAMRAAMEGSGLRERLRRDGLKRAADFSWDRCAMETLAVFNKMIPEKAKALAGFAL